MPNLDLIDITGKKVGQVDLPKEIFAAKINQNLMALAVRVYLANQRRAKARTKTRAEIKRTKAKWYRQKGTGRARHGARSAPIFVGGGVAHGPRGKENFKLKITKKMKKAALFSALTSKLKDKKIWVVKDLGKVEPKTKSMIMVLKKLKFFEPKKKREKMMLVLSEKPENIIRSARNIEGVRLFLADQLNTYEVLNGGKLIFMKDSISRLKEIYLEVK